MPWLTKLQALPLEPDILSLPADFLLILNNFVNENRLPEIEYTALDKAYPPRFLFDDAKKSSHRGPQSVHAECTLCAYLSALAGTGKHVAIGCFKRSC